MTRSARKLRNPLTTKPGAPCCDARERLLGDARRRDVSPTFSVGGGASLRTSARRARDLPTRRRLTSRAGARGRTGDVQLGKRSGPLGGKGFSAAVAEIG